MLENLNVVIPILGWLVVGQALRLTGLVQRAEWDGVETLAFRLLIPMMVINAIYRAEFDLGTAGPFLIVLFATTTLVGLLALSLALLPGGLRPKNPDLTSVFQASIRWNAIVPLQAVAVAFGDPGLAFVAIGLALLVPSINVACISVLASFSDVRTSPMRILITIASNPLVVASAIGFLLHLSAIKLPDFAEVMLQKGAEASLVVGLVSVGAGFRLARLFNPGLWVFTAVGLRSFLAPTIGFVLARALDLSHLETLVVLLMLSAPAAANGYIVARKMGGNAEAYACAMTWQLLASILLIPFILSLPV